MTAPAALPCALSLTLLFAAGVNSATAALAALWRFDTAGGSQADSTTNGNTATSVNGAVQVLDGTRASGTMQFDGVDDFMQAADSASLSITGNMTIAFWMNLTTLGTAGQYRGIISKTVSNGNPAPYEFWFNQGNSVPGFGRGDGTNGDFAFSNVVPTAQVWQHWAITQSGTTVTMYLNGTPIAMSDNLVSTLTADQNGSLIIGDRPGAQDMSFVGRLDDVAIFDEALTQAQINTIGTGDFSAFGVVPEPTTMALAPLAGLGLLRRRRATV